MTIPATPIENYGDVIALIKATLAQNEPGADRAALLRLLAVLEGEK